MVASMRRDVAAIDPRIAFWKDQSAWPDDVVEYVFLGRVVGAVGQAVYGSEWTGSEPTTELITPLPDFLVASISKAELMRGCRLLFDHDEAYKVRCPAYAEFLQAWPMPRDDEWVRAVATSKHLSEQNQRDYGRYVDVSFRLAQAFKAGAILTATREVAGGLIRDHNRWLWNTENFWGRFHTCRIDHDNPFSGTVVSSGGSYIFVGRASLVRLLQPPSEPSEITAPSFSPREYISPFIRCMIEATRDLKITADDKRKKSEIVSELRKYWPGSQDDLQDTDLERMATLMREPRHKHGRWKHKT